MDEPISCPICGKVAERGCLYGADRSVFRWLPGEPNLDKNISTGFLGEGQVVGTHKFFAGTFARGIRCAACRRVILDYEPEP